MKKILCIIMACIAIFSFCSCTTIDSIGNTVEEKLDNILNQSNIKATGEVANNPVNVFKVFNDKIILTVDTNIVLNAMNKDGVTLETLKAEKENAETAHMDFKLEYEYVVGFQVNKKVQIATCSIPVTEETLNNTVDITVPVDPKDMGVTIYELLQGKSISVDGCLKHGTDKTSVVSTIYYLNKKSDDPNIKTLTMEDNRTY